MRILSGYTNALSAARHTAPTTQQRGSRQALPGLQSVSLDTSPSGSQAPEWPGSTPDPGPGPTPGPGVVRRERVGRRAPGGTPAEEPAPPGDTVPVVQSTHAYGHGGHTFTTPPQASLQKALADARVGEWWRLVSWQEDAGCYLVPSRTTPGQRYTITRRKGTSRSDPWWWRYECTCPAHTSGRYLACWHKAATHIRLQHLTSRVKVGLPATLPVARE